MLRLYPSVPVNSREAVRATTLPNSGGSDGRAPLLVHKGEAVGYCVYAMHRRREIYGEDADEFRPERDILQHGEREPCTDKQSTGIALDPVSL